jgi:hypothetical protein
MVSLNAHDATERLGEVDQYADNLRVTFPLGFEQTRSGGQFSGFGRNDLGLLGHVSAIELFFRAIERATRLAISF